MRLPSIAVDQLRARLDSVSRTLASLSSRMNASLSAFVCGLTVMKTPPASSVPKIETQHDAVLSMKIATRSPRSSPCSCSALREPRRLVEELRVREARLLRHDRRLVAEVVRRDEQAVVEQALVARASASVATVWVNERPPGDGVPTGRLRRRRHASAGRQAARVGFATSCSCRSIVEIAPTSAISSVSLARSAFASNFATTRWTASGRKIAGGAQALGAQQLADVLGRVLADEDAADRRPVRTLAARVDLLRQERADGAPQRVLLLEPAQPQPVGQRGGELRDAVVEEREAALDRVAHQHPVALRVQQVALEEGLDLDVLRLAERAEALEPLGQPRDQARGRVVGGAGALDEPGVEHAERARGVREADAVAVERVVRLGQAAPVEARDEGARALEVAAR